MEKPYHKNPPGVFEFALGDVDLEDAAEDDHPHQVICESSLGTTVPIYPHGYSIRVAILLPAKDARAALAKCGWASPAPKGWTTMAGRDTLRGSAWLSGRKPANKRLPLSKRNAEWRTALYGLTVEARETETFVDLTGTRWSNVPRFMQSVLGLRPNQYVVSYYRAVEFFCVLTPCEALHLQQAMGGAVAQEVEFGRGKKRRGKKRFLVHKKQAYPVTVGRRTPMAADLKLYKIEGGATAAFRCEVRLAGRKRDRHTFGPEVFPRLHQILLDLVDQYDLHPISKPSRWECFDPDDGIWTGEFDEALRAVTKKAWRGYRPEALGGECHRLPPPKRLESRVSVATSTSPVRIRTRHLLLHAPSGMNPSPSTDRIWASLALQIISHTGYLSEVILDPDQDPAALVAALSQSGSTMALTVLFDGYQSWHTLDEYLREHPFVGNPDLWVVVIDTSVSNLILDSVIITDPVTQEFLQADQPDLTSHPPFESLPGPLWPPSWQMSRGVQAATVRATGLWLSPVFEGWRKVCEETGLNIVVVTTDARPRHGLGPLLKRHRYTDGRVRSHIGDAGRYWCHARYYLLPGPITGHACQAVLWKDELEGRTGRILRRTGTPR